MTSNRICGRRLGLFLLLMVPFMGALGASAHQASLAILQLTEMSEGVYIMRWENAPTESTGDVFLDLGPTWPPGCTDDGEILTCGPRGLSGTVGFAGLGEAQSAAMIKVRDLTGETRVVTLTPASPTARLLGTLHSAGWAGVAQIVTTYTALGIEHIAIGIDHLLFVLGLMLIAGTARRLVKTITAFTLAHSVTLTAVSFAWIGVPEAFVDVMIALSIVFVGVEVMSKLAGRSTATLRHPEYVSFGFGLLHGFGFAGALVELGLPEGARIWALAAFNIGVEIGQLLFVLVTLALVWAWREMTAPVPARIFASTAYTIGGLASFWFIDRFLFLFGVA